MVFVAPPLLMQAGRLEAGGAAAGALLRDRERPFPDVARLLAWGRLAAASVAVALAPWLGGEPARVRLALVAGLLWLPWAWLALLLVAPPRRARDGAALVGDVVVLGPSLALLPEVRGVLLVVGAVVVLLHALALAVRTARVDRRAVAMVTAAEQRLSIVLDQIPVVMWTTDQALAVTSRLGGRGEWERLLPRGRAGSAAERLGDRNRALLRAHRAALAGEGCDCEILVGGRSYQAFLRPLRDRAGDVTGVVGAALDVTDRKLAEEAKTMFLATASHELKTPLTVIKGFAQTLARPAAALDASLREEAVEAILRRSDELTRIVDRLLLSSRIESGGLDVAVEEVDVSAVVGERVETLRRATGRQIATLFDPHVPPAAADEAALGIALDHLLDNAIKYSPEGGPVSVTLAATRGEVVVAVSDSGVGMGPQELARCFDKFWQADGSDRRRFRGTGIGLFIVRSLVEAMDGRVSAASEPGKGSTFTVTLRRADASGDGGATPRREPGVGQSSVIREFMRQIGVPTGGGT